MYYYILQITNFRNYTFGQKLSCGLYFFCWFCCCFFGGFFVKFISLWVKGEVIILMTASKEEEKKKLLQNNKESVIFWFPTEAQSCKVPRFHRGNSLIESCISWSNLKTHLALLRLSAQN